MCLPPDLRHPRLQAWLAQVVSATGDARRMAITPAPGSAGGECVAVGLFSVPAGPRILPRSWAGVLVDRWDRKRMINCDIARAAVRWSLSSGSVMG